MKIVLKNIPKPRAFAVNAVLRSKRSERHQDPRRPTRQQQKQQSIQEYKESIQESI